MTCVLRGLFTVFKAFQGTIYVVCAVKYLMLLDHVCCRLDFNSGKYFFQAMIICDSKLTLERNSANECDFSTRF